MKNIALEKLRTGSWDICNAASRYRFSRSFEVVGPPNGSDSLNPADALAPIITMRAQGAFSAAPTADDLCALVALCESAAPTEPTIQPQTMQNRRAKTREPFPIANFSGHLPPESLLKA